MTAGDRVGVMGGTFDPIHAGHLAAARAASEATALTRVLFVPSHRPPHRPDTPAASGYHRLAMTALAVDGVPGSMAVASHVQTGTFDFAKAKFTKGGAKPNAGRSIPRISSTRPAS